ncbi:hypothetical protein LDENG_00130410 [Lucifuga dentata]|nr:hypothetical protein LDENG_00130410 [Lucifuga dentata]
MTVNRPSLFDDVRALWQEQENVISQRGVNMSSSQEVKAEPEEFAVDPEGLVEVEKEEEEDGAVMKVLLQDDDMVRRSIQHVFKAFSSVCCDLFIFYLLSLYL